jgi:hypothetical protein
MLKKILFRGLIGLIVLALGAGLWWAWSQGSRALSQIGQDRIELAELKRQRDILLKDRAALQARVATLEPQAAELEAIRSALASGVILADLSTALKGPGGVTAERLLALGASRLLIHGREDEEARRAFDQALEMMQWDSRLRSVCAAQAGLASAGRPIIPLADCKRLGSQRSDAAGSTPEKPPTQPASADRAAPVQNASGASPASGR